MTGACRVTIQDCIEFLIRIILGNRTGNHVCRAAFAIQIYAVITYGLLIPVGHETLVNDQSCALSEFCLCITDGVIDSLDLGHLHLHVAVFFHVDFRARIEDALAGTVSGTIVFFDVFYLRALTDIEAVDTVVLTVLRTAVIDTAAGNDHDIGALADIKVVIDDFLDAACCHDDRDVYTFVLRARLDLYIDTRTVFLRDDVDIRRRITGDCLTVGTDIKCTYRDLVKVGNFRQKAI